MRQAAVFALCAAAVFGAESKPAAVEITGPETAEAARLEGGLEWQALSRTEKALPLTVVVISPGQAVSASPPKLVLNAFGSAALTLKMAAGAVKAGADFPVFVQLRTAKNELTLEKKLSVTQAAPQISVKELGGWKMRGWLSPLDPDKEVCLPAPLSFPLPEAQPGAGQGATFAQRTEGGFAELKVTQSNQSGARVCLVEPQSGTYAGEVTPSWNGRPLGSVKLKAIVADGPVLALLCALAGVMGAWYLKHALNVSRVVWGLRRRAAAAFQKFDSESEPAFRNAVNGHERLANLKLRPPAVDKWKAADQAAENLDRAFLVKIDEAELKSVDEQVKALESLGGDWAAFGQAQARLDSEYQHIAEAEAASRAARPQTCAGLPQFGQAVSGALQAANVRPEEIGARLQTAQTMSPAAREWVRVHNLLLALDGEWRQIDPATATARVRQLLGMAKLSWDSAWNRLWAAPRAEDIAALSNLPAGVGTAISQLQDERGIESDAAVQNAIGAAPAEDIPVNPAAAVEAIGDRIRTSERTLILAAAALAMAAGMSTSYLGQPFGSLKNYLDLFLWGAGTKTGLDILMPMVEQLSSLLPKTSK